MSNPKESVSIGDDGTLDTVVDYDGRFGTTRCRYDSHNDGKERGGWRSLYLS